MVGLFSTVILMPYPAGPVRRHPQRIALSAYVAQLPTQFLQFVRRTPIVQLRVRRNRSRVLADKQLQQDKSVRVDMTSLAHHCPRGNGQTMSSLFLKEPQTMFQLGQIWITGYQLLLQMAETILITVSYLPQLRRSVRHRARRAIEPLGKK